jgi:hypothetical protein
MKGAKILLAVSAVLAIGAGAAMIFATAAFLGPQGISVDDKVALLGQAQGALLVGIGVLNLLAMRCSDAKGLQAVLGGNLALQITGLGVNIHGLAANLVTHQVYGDVVLHVILGVLFAFFYVRVGKAPAAA